MATSKTTKTKSVPETAQTSTPVPETNSTPAKRLTRSTLDKVVCGVCGGLGEYLSIDPIIIRLLFVILTMSGGSGILIYLILCIILPEKASLGKTTKEVVAENSNNLEKTIEDVAENVKAMASLRNTQTWLGIGIIIIGSMFMANNVGLFDVGSLMRIVARMLWPLAIIAIGIIILSKSKRGS